MTPLVALAIGLFVLAVLYALFRPDEGMIARWGKTRRLTRRVLAEDALKHLYKRETRRHNATLEGIAGALGISLNEAAGVVEEMREDELVVGDSDGFHLTDKGREAALHIVRAHRLWERYLAEETGFAEEEWHTKADQREHTLSRSATQDLAAQLGNPSHDPHGDPIPTESGSVLVGQAGQPLTQLPSGSVARIIHLEDEPEVVYAQLAADGLHPGMELQIMESSPQRVRFWAEGREHVLAPIVAANVTAAELAEEAAPQPADGEMALSSLDLGETARVVRIDGACRGAERRRFLDLGLVPGTEVTAEMRSPGGDPTAYRIRDTLIALRASQAQHIRVTTEDNGEIDE